MSWFRIDNSGLTVVVRIAENIGCFGVSAGDFLEELPGDKPIEFVINSTGGCMVTALQVYRELQDRADCGYQFVSSATITGHCGSSAVPFAMLAQRIRIVRDGRFLVHGPSASVLGMASDLRQTADYLDRMNSELIRMFMARGIHGEDAGNWLKKDTYFDSAQAVSAKLADEIFDLPAEAESEEPELRVIATVQDDGSAALLLDLLRALGPIQTSDRARLMRNLSMWAASSVVQI